MANAFIFPGQGSQAVGMGRELAEAFAAARHVFQEVDDALSQKLFKLMGDGPETELTLTENAQPALIAVSMAVVRVLEEQSGKPITKLCGYVAGHSLGEYSALAAAGTLTIADAARLLKLRGQAMQAAVPVGEGAMAALLGVDLEQAKAIAAEAAAGEVCDLANDNGGGQIVISGSAAAIARAVALAPAKGAKRAIPLSVSAPFHCALMAPAAKAMEAALAKATVLAPRVPLVANVTAAPGSDPDEIRAQLVEQVCAMVRWRESVEAMAGLGVTRYVECGSGKVLAGLVKRIAKDADARSVGAPADVEAVLKEIV